MSSDTRAEILGLGARWAEAERRADTVALDKLAADSFRLVGRSGSCSTKHSGSPAT
jgi:hypothetical protein